MAGANLGGWAVVGRPPKKMEPQKNHSIFGAALYDVIYLLRA
jgi:hypothetical protein